MRDGKTQSMCLVWAMIGVLPQDNHLDLSKGGGLECLKNLVFGGVDSIPLVLVSRNPAQDGLKVVLFFFRAKNVLPCRLFRCHKPINQVLFENRMAGHINATGFVKVVVFDIDVINEARSYFDGEVRVAILAGYQKTFPFLVANI